MRKFLSIFIPVVVCFLTGLTASYFQADAIESWYPFLNKPALTPPNIVFPVAWGIIYLCIGISVGLVILTQSLYRKTVVTLFVVQLFFNFLWSILFFYFRNPLLGFIDILILDFLVLFYVVRSYQVRKIASYLFLPYLLWLCFATYLNGFILLNN
ncbi:MAG: tryptophan-rich sensory protein [Bacteroidales bacterium]|nr:tryptophan-rich sensory protein [Bacteroidales bacterium]